MDGRSITRDALAIGLATGAYAVSFGVLAITAGLSVAQACAMSALVFTGASQFAVVGVLGAGGSALAALAPALLLAARNAVYGIALVPVLRGRRASRALQAPARRPRRTESGRRTSQDAQDSAGGGPSRSRRSSAAPSAPVMPEM